MKLVKTRISILILAFFYVSLFFIASEAVLAADEAVSSASPTQDLFSTASAPAAATMPFYMEEQTTASMPAFLESDPLGSGLRVFSSLALIILVIFALSWFLQKRGGIGGNVYGKTIGILPLDNKRMLYIVDVMGKVLILGVTEHNISMLCEVTDKITLDALRLQYEKPREGMEKFFSFIKPKSSLTEEPAETSEEVKTELPEQETATFAQRTDERLRRLNELLAKSKDPDKQ